MSAAGTPDRGHHTAGSATIQNDLRRLTTGPCVCGYDVLVGIYSKYILPWGMEFCMRDDRFTRLRQRLLAPVRGEVLEIGFGTGLNLLHYNPASVSRLTFVDVNPGMHRKARERIDASPIPVDVKVLSAETLPFDDAMFDFVVSTWTLCSIPDLPAALREMRRVLKPDGRFLFVEHGLSPDANVQRWQHRLNPLQKLWGGGCNLNRNIRQFITDAGFAIDTLETFYREKDPRFLGYTYFGSARPMSDSVERERALASTHPA